MNALYEQADEYLMIRRALGFKLRGHDRLLHDFVAFLDLNDGPTITSALALRWATQPVGLQQVRWAQRLSAVRGFARHAHALDQSVEVPPVDLLPCRRQRPVPYLYTSADLARLVSACAPIQPAFRASTYETFFGLLASTGMRVGEAIHLDTNDVDLTNGVIEINDAKFRKHRRLPLHSSTVAALARYRTARNERYPNPKAPAFFVSTRGTRLQDVNVHEVFRALVDSISLPTQPGAGTPMVHGMRHSFAVATLRNWYRSGVDVNGKLPVLSAYLGHADPSSTYWYLQACPELLGLAAARLEQFENSAR